MGEVAFAGQVAEGTRRGGRPTNGARSGHDRGFGERGQADRAPVAVGPGPSPEPVIARTVPLVSPLRGGTVTGSIEVRLGGQGTSPRPRPAEPVTEPPEPSSVAALDGDREEPPLPDEARWAMAATVGPDVETAPASAAPGQVLQVRIRVADQERLVRAFEELRAIVTDRPGETPVVLLLPSRDGSDNTMQLRSGVAYDLDLVAEIGRRLGGLASAQLA
jgi:hypothetical protein